MSTLFGQQAVLVSDNWNVPVAQKLDPGGFSLERRKAGTGPLRLALRTVIDSYLLVIPLPSVIVTTLSIAGRSTTSRAPAGHLISSLSTFVAVFRPKCRR